MATTKISITIDTERLEELKSLAGAGISLSAVIDQALMIELHRYPMIALLDDMEKRNPITAEGREAGAKLWQQIKSSSIPAPSRRSPKKKTASASRSNKP